MPRKKLTEAEKWQRKADRANAKARVAAGLFADTDWVPTVTGDDLAARRQRKKEAADQHARRFWAAAYQMMIAAHAARAVCRDVLPPEVVADLDRRRRACPDGPEYTADVYCGALRAAGFAAPSPETLPVTCRESA